MIRATQPEGGKLTLGTHPLKGNRKGEWGMTVTKNWRITFRFEAGDADEVASARPVRVICLLAN